MELTVTKIDLASRGLLKQLAARETVLHERTVTMPEVLKWLILAGFEKTDTLILFKSLGVKSKSKSKRRVKSKSKDYTTDFEVIWDGYPKGSGKREAFIAWEKVKEKVGAHKGLPAPRVATILQVVSWKMKTDMWTLDDRKYVERLSTFLNNRRWEDEPDSPIRAEPIEKFERLAKEIHAAYLKRQEPKQ